MTANGTVPEKTVPLSVISDDAKEIGIFKEKFK